MNRSPDRDEFSLAVGAQEIGRVRNADDSCLTFLPREIPGAITRNPFHDRTVDAPVQDPIRLMVSGVGLDSGDDPVGSDFDDFEADLLAPGVDPFLFAF